jgi:hypothetical protein
MIISVQVEEISIPSFDEMDPEKIRFRCRRTLDFFRLSPEKLRFRAAEALRNISFFTTTTSTLITMIENRPNLKISTTLKYAYSTHQTSQISCSGKKRGWRSKERRHVYQGGVFM